jgi:hypothetical protein
MSVSTFYFKLFLVSSYDYDCARGTSDTLVYQTTALWLDYILAAQQTYTNVRPRGARVKKRLE